MSLTISQARVALNVPARCANNNCVIDGQARLREALDLAMGGKTQLYTEDSEAPSYVLRAVKGLQSWITHHDEQAAREAQYR